jgi:hypothetical protein
MKAEETKEGGRHTRNSNEDPKIAENLYPPKYLLEKRTKTLNDHVLKAAQ